MNPSRRLALSLLCILAVTACASSAPRLKLPNRTEANCESKSVKQTAIESIVASVDDTVRPGVYPGDAKLRAIIKSKGGVIASWDAQTFHAPDTAKALGVAGDLDLRRAVITNELQGDPKDRLGQYRPVWLTFATPSGDKTVLERAYDVQNVCVEGRREA